MLELGQHSIESVIISDSDHGSILQQRQKEAVRGLPYTSAVSAKLLGEGVAEHCILPYVVIVKLVEVRAENLTSADTASKAQQNS